MTPGLIDCHTHLVYGGNRIEEFEKRLCGASYEDIARSGGGIQATVNATRMADTASLIAGAAVRVKRLMSEGVTTLEVKSGYGLDLETERRMLEVARTLERELPVSVKTTYLGLHALPREYRDEREAYVNLASREWLDSLAAAGLVDAVDAFCEKIAFTVAETEQFLRAAQTSGDSRTRSRGPIERHGSGGAGRAVRCAVRRSSRVRERGRRAGARRRGHGRGALARRLFHAAPDDSAAGRAAAPAGVPMAVATDCNPGTSPCYVASSRAQHELRPVRPHAGGIAERRHAQRRPGVGLARRSSALSRWASARTSRCGESSGPPSCATTWARTPAPASSIGAPPDVGSLSE